MLKTLVTLGFGGTIYLYMMYQVGEDTSWIHSFQQELSKSPLSINFIEYEVPEPYGKKISLNVLIYLCIISHF